MWNDSEPGSNFSHLGDTYPVHTLYAFDGPKIFTFRGVDGILYLAYFSEDVGNAERFIVSYTSDKILEDLWSRRISVREAFTFDNVWVIDRDSEEGLIVRAWKVSKDDLPQDLLPPLGVRLFLGSPIVP